MLLIQSARGQFEFCLLICVLCDSDLGINNTCPKENGNLVHACTNFKFSWTTNLKTSVLQSKVCSSTHVLTWLLRIELRRKISLFLIKKSKQEVGKFQIGMAYFVLMQELPQLFSCIYSTANCVWCLTQIHLKSWQVINLKLHIHMHISYITHSTIYVTCSSCTHTINWSLLPAQTSAYTFSFKGT